MNVGGVHMKVLVACEESQTVCKAFRAVGCEAYSCDIQDCSGGHPEWHIQADVIPLLNGRCGFFTCDGVFHCIDTTWDLIIAHPPCTFLTPAGACNIPRDSSRIDKGFEAASFFNLFLNADCDCIAVENPPPMKRFGLPMYTQIIQPFYFGDPYNKPTCLWLKGLCCLEPTHVVRPQKERYMWFSHSLGKVMTLSLWYQKANKNGEWSKNRSKTFPGIANAMALQWSSPYRNGLWGCFDGY